MSLRMMLGVMLWVLLSLCAGCAAHPPRLNCDGPLKPINTPAPLKPAEAVHP